MAPALSVRFPADVDSVSAIRSAVSEVARAHGCDRQKLEDLLLAVSEAATNAIVHGSRFDSEVTLEAHASGCELTVLIADEGAGLRPRADSPGLGLGLPIIAGLADRLEVTSTDSGTQVWMVFDCAS
jgi:anti-sigma regulatory factor (Ser/Thr protein kinase)